MKTEYEISKDEAIQIIASIPVNKGGYPEYMLEDILSFVDLLNDRSNVTGIRIAFIKTK